jgi:uncharacterized protein
VRKMSRVTRGSRACVQDSNLPSQFRISARRCSELSNLPLAEGITGLALSAPPLSQPLLTSHQSDIVAVLRLLPRRTKRVYMDKIPDSVTTFLRGRRIAVAGVSRNPSQAANAVFNKLRRAGYEACAINPRATEVEGARCYSDVGAVPGQLDGVVIVTPPEISVQIVRQCRDHGVRQVWFHRSFGNGSVSEEAVRECDARGIACIVGGCPLMFCAPVDFGHRCMRWWLQRQDRVPR